MYDPTLPHSTRPYPPKSGVAVTPCVARDINDFDAALIWAGRHAADIGGQIDKMAAWMEEAVQPPGCSAKVGLCHTWSLVKSIAVVDHPACRRIARNLVPMILRAQQPDGGWGDDEHSTLWTLTLLKKHGLFEQLRQLPPLPPDWRTVRSIPAPGKKPWALAWDGKQLWVHDRDEESRAAIAVSAKDGEVLKTVKLPKLKQCSPIGIWDGDLTLTTHGRERALFRIDAETGQVVRRVSLRFLGDFLSTATQMGDKLIIGDHFDVPGRDDIDYLAGTAVPANTACPDGLALREVIAARYAEFACTVATIHSTHEHIFHTWIHASPYTHDDPKPCVEQYAPGTDSGQSEVLIHIPIRTEQTERRGQ